MIGDQDCARAASQLISDRDRRYEIFPSEIFDEFAWNMLLHLFIALESNVVMSEARLCELSHAGQDTGRRWIRHLVTDGQLETREDGADVILTRAAVDRLRRYLRPSTDRVVTRAES